MIIPMTKFSFLVFHKDYQVFIDQMQALGVLHLIEKQHEISDDIREQYDLVRHIDSMIKSLEKREIEQVSEAGSARGEELYKEVVDLQEQLEHKVLQLNQLNKCNLDPSPLIPMDICSMTYLTKFHVKMWISFLFLWTEPPGKPMIPSGARAVMMQ